MLYGVVHPLSLIVVGKPYLPFIGLLLTEGKVHGFVILLRGMSKFDDVGLQIGEVLSGFLV